MESLGEHEPDEGDPPDEPGVPVAVPPALAVPGRKREPYRPPMPLPVIPFPPPVGFPIPVPPPGVPVPVPRVPRVPRVPWRPPPLVEPELPERVAASMQDAISFQDPRIFGPVQWRAEKMAEEAVAQEAEDFRHKRRPSKRPPKQRPPPKQVQPAARPKPGGSMRPTGGVPRGGGMPAQFDQRRRMPFMFQGGVRRRLADLARSGGPRHV